MFGVSARGGSLRISSSSASVVTMLILLPWRRSIRLPRESNERERSFSGRMPEAEGTELSIEDTEEPGERRGEVEVVVVLDLLRPLKTDRRLGLWEWE